MGIYDEQSFVHSSREHTSSKMAPVMTEADCKQHERDIVRLQEEVRSIREAIKYTRRCISRQETRLADLRDREHTNTDAVDITEGMRTLADARKVLADLEQRVVKMDNDYKAEREFLENYMSRLRFCEAVYDIPPSPTERCLVCDKTYTRKSGNVWWRRRRCCGRYVCQVCRLLGRTCTCIVDDAR